ncbi:Nucleotid-trans domain-containing protein [Aphelenchoides bicaudatus]|nr:Nucleotid-trans domain-containing protein [Aphelenchoides bicaudatus]
MKWLKWRFPFIILFVGALFLNSKFRKSSESLNFLRDATDEFKTDIFAGGPDLDEVLQKVRSPAILLLNKHALKITLNFLCNVRQFDGVLERIVVFAFDYHSKVVIRSSFPSVHEDTFAAGDGRYQLFQFFRAQLSTYLTKKVESFWMIQADTVWRKNLFEVLGMQFILRSNFKLSCLDVSNLQQDLLFDCEGEKGLLSKMIAGGYFYVRSSEKDSAILLKHRCNTS